jgi:F0F1-type ATP synthase membrane subunit c/vacuolar-type H+-ATPase subunit K
MVKTPVEGKVVTPGVGRGTLGVAGAELAAELEGLTTTVTVLVLVECKVVTASEVTVLGVGVATGITIYVSSGSL